MNPAKKTKKFKFVEHTADVEIKVWGNNLEDLFKNSFYGLLNIISKETIPGKETRLIEITSPDNESLLVDFLNEVIYLITTRGWLPSEVVTLEITDTNLKTKLNGKVISSPELIKTEVKATTYHNLKIKHNVDKWETNICFDI